MRGFRKYVEDKKSKKYRETVVVVVVLVVKGWRDPRKCAKLLLSTRSLSTFALPSSDSFTTNELEQSLTHGQTRQEKTERGERLVLYLPTTHC